MYKISPGTNLYKTANKKLVLRYCPCLKKKKKHIRLGHAGIVDPSVDLALRLCSKELKDEDMEVKVAEAFESKHLPDELSLCSKGHSSANKKHTIVEKLV